MYWDKHILITDIDNKYGARAISYEILGNKLKKISSNCSRYFTKTQYNLNFYLQTLNRGMFC